MSEDEILAIIKDIPCKIKWIDSESLELHYECDKETGLWAFIELQAYELYSIQKYFPEILVKVKGYEREKH